MNQRFSTGGGSCSDWVAASWAEDLKHIYICIYIYKENHGHLFLQDTQLNSMTSINNLLDMTECGLAFLFLWNKFETRPNCLSLHQLGTTELNHLVILGQTEVKRDRVLSKDKI